MLAQANELADGTRLEADIAIIGGGAVGIAMATHLAGTGRRVVVLEAGGLGLDSRAQDFAAGEASGVPYFALDESRYRMLGGSTYRWGARTAPMTPFDMGPRDWLGLKGWPIGRADLDPWYDRVFDMVGLHRPFAFDAGVWQHMKVRPPAFDTQTFDQAAFQFGRNLLFGSVFRETLKAAANVRVLLGATVEAIVANPAGDHVERLDVRSEGDKRLTVVADRYVLAAGGIENARLLLLSGGGDPAGLANGSGLVGRFFMEHPTVSAGTIVTDQPNALIDAFAPGLVGGRLVETGLVLRPEIQRATGSLNAVARVAIDPGDDATQAMRELIRNLRHRRWPTEVSWYQKNRWLAQRLRAIAADPVSIVSNVVRHRMGLPKRYRINAIRLELRTEQEPNPDSRVTLSDARDAAGQRRAHLHWALTVRDKATMRTLAERVDGELRRLGLGRLERAPWLDLDDLVFGADLVGGHHHIGTTRMAADPAEGVVDADCRAHAAHNLYITGASVFPTAGYVNPTGTALALALRLADRLART